MTRMFVVLCALTLAGCGAAKIDSRANARAEYQKSIDDEYRGCINDNLKNVEKCQAKRAFGWFSRWADRPVRPRCHCPKVER